MKKKRLFVTTALSVITALAMSVFAMPLTFASAASSGKVTMYRLYNPNSGEHFYTKNTSERNTLKGAGWKDEGEGWIAPEKSETPVYRLYNPIAGDHHYTMSKTEHDGLVSAGWNSEGIGWYSDDAKSVPLYREYNPNAVTGTHNYTTDKSEHDFLVSVGWKGEGIGWYGLSTEGQDPKDDDVLNSISLSETSVDLQVGKTTTLKVNYNPSNYIGDKKVTWTSSNTSVATVNNSGVVTAVSVGKATITASVNGKSAKCDVKVDDTLTKISLSETSMELKTGETKSLKVSFDPTDYNGDKTVTWTSSNTSVATVNNSGVVTAVSVGKATITASVNGKSASCAVNVIKAASKSGYQIVKEYVLANGEKKDDHYTCYQRNSEWLTAITVYSNEDRLVFGFVYRSEGSTTINTSLVTLTPNEDWALLYMTSKFDDGTEVSVSTIVDKKTYDAEKDTLQFSYESGDKKLYDIGRDELNQLANTMFKATFRYCNTWFKNIGTNMNEVGFPAYSGS